jgi:hypothetical protein
MSLIPVLDAAHRNTGQQRTAPAADAAAAVVGGSQTPLKRTAPLLPSRTPAQQTSSHPDVSSLTAQTRAFAATLAAEVAEQYLEFRRVYYHEAAPSLTTLPSAHAEIRQAELAYVAERTLHVLPPAVKSLPVIGGLLDHLQDVANIHSISERERTALHNMTVLFLDGMRDGIQPWYLAWLLASAHNLAAQTDPRYYMTNPYDALLYRPAARQSDLEQAVRDQDVAGVEREMRRLANRLIEVLRDPIGTQPDLAFTGPDATHRRVLFHLKTTVALVLGAYLVTEELRALLDARERRADPPSALAPLPPQQKVRLLTTSRGAPAAGR